MKQIIIALALMLGVSASAQSKKEFNFKTRGAVKNIENYQKRHPEKTLEETFADSKLKKLEKIVKIDDAQKATLTEIYKKEWSVLKSAYATFEENETPENKANLIKTLIKIEDETRAVLTEPQLSTYKAFNKNSVDSFDFTGIAMYYFTEPTYQEYKKL